MITKTKYSFLQSLANTMSDTERKQCSEYEGKNGKPEPTPAEIEYNKKLRVVRESDFKVNYNILLTRFKEKFLEIEGRAFSDVMLSNIQTVLYYFSKHPEFFNCDNLSNLSKPSFDKGLLIIGEYGNGKTSTMRVLKQLFNNTPLTFKMYTSNKIVSTFEGHQEASERTAYMNRTKTATAYFDDVKTEKIASNYGKHNLMKEILEERYISKNKTYITCNFRDGDRLNNMQDALNEFGDSYGPRVYDRLFEMFNIIEFKGKSLRV